MGLFDFILAKDERDYLGEKLKGVDIYKKQKNIFGLVLVLSLVVVLTGLLSMFLITNKEPPKAYAVDYKNDKILPVQALNMPFNSYKNIRDWVGTAVMNTYSFDFNDFDSVVQRAAYYFDKNGYEAYLKALEESGIKNQIIRGKVKVSTVVIGNPAYIGGMTLGNTEYYRFQVPVMVSFYKGGKPTIVKKVVSVLIKRLDTTKNLRGLGIVEYKFLN